MDAPSEDIPSTPGAYVSWAMDEHVGCGRFQYFSILALCWAANILCVHTYAEMFASQRQTWHLDCDIGAPAASGNMTKCPVLTQPENCSVPLEQWRVDKPGLSIEGDFALVCRRHHGVPSLVSIYFVGFAIGVVAIGGLSDTRGRRIAFLVGQLCLGAGGFIAPWAPSFTWYAVSRFLVGAGVAGVGLVSFVWATEFLDTSSRNVMSWLPNIAFSIGQLLTSPLAYYIPQWRPFMLATNVVAMTGLLFWCALAESPRWLAVAGRVDEACSVLGAMAKTNGRAPPPPPPSKCEEGGDALVPEPPESSFFADICDRRLRFRFLVLCFNWFSISLAFYGVSMSSPNLPLDIYMANVLSALTPIPFYAAAPILISATWCGRRGAIVGSFIAGGVCLLLSAVMEDETASVAVYFAGNGALSLAFAVLYMWTSELYPTTIRARSMSINSVCARFGAICSPFVVDIGRTNPALATVVFAAPCLICGCLDLMLPETNGRKMLSTIDDVGSGSDSVGPEMSENEDLSASGTD